MGWGRLRVRYPATRVGWVSSCAGELSSAGESSAGQPSGAVGIGDQQRTDDGSPAARGDQSAASCEAHTVEHAGSTKMVDSGGHPDSTGCS